MQDLIEHAQRVSRKAVEDLTEPQEDILPVMVCSGPHGISVMLLSEMGGDDASKDQLALWMTATLVVTRAAAAVTVTTAWMTKMSLDDPDVDLLAGTIKEPVSERSDRVEGVALVCCSRDTEVLITAPLTRHEDRPPTLGDWIRLGDGNGMTGGRFGEAMYRGLKMAEEMPAEMVDLIEDGWAEGNPQDLIQRFVNVAREVSGSGHPTREGE